VGNADFRRAGGIFRRALLVGHYLCQKKPLKIGISLNGEKKAWGLAILFILTVGAAIWAAKMK
jgi:hypothetical protein